MDKNKYIVRNVAGQKIQKASCKYESMSVLELRCSMKSLGFKGITDGVVREDMYKALKKIPDAVHLFVEYPPNMLSFKKEKRQEAEREYGRRINLFK